jgi:serine protease Do
MPTATRWFEFAAWCARSITLALRGSAFLCWAAFPVVATAQTQRATKVAALSDLSRSFQELVDRVDPSVVQVITRGFAPSDESGEPPRLRARRNSGSGVIVDRDGYIITNAHVIGSARRVQVLLAERMDREIRSAIPIKPEGRILQARVIGIDRVADLAVLKTDQTGLPALRFAGSEGLRQGHLVFAFGSPFGLENSVTMGVVSSVSRQVRPEDPITFIQTDAAINPGNSGGPLVNTDGALVGINTFILSAAGVNTGVGFAIPADLARGVYEQIRKYGRVRRGAIGVQVQTITPGLAQALRLPRDWGVMLTDVLPGSAASAADLQPRDILLRVDGKVMENGRHFGSLIYQSAGRTLSIDILRGSEVISRQVAVLERPKDPERVLSLITGESNMVPKLGLLAVDLDESVTPLLPSLRKLAGVVVAGVVADLSSQDDAFLAGDVVYAVNDVQVRSLADLKAAVSDLEHGQPVAVEIERDGRIQFLLLEIE